MSLGAPVGCLAWHQEERNFARDAGGGHAGGVAGPSELAPEDVRLDGVDAGVSELGSYAFTRASTREVLVDFIYKSIQGWRTRSAVSSC